MDEQPPIFSGLAAELAEAQTALAAFAQGPARQAADAIAEDFAKAGRRIGASLGQAIVSGEDGFRSLARVALTELAKIALQRIGLAPSAGASLPAAFFGARANGGAVTPGGAYLVGERGPELFQPGVSGRIAPLGGAGAGVAVHFHLGPGVSGEDVRRHSGQIAAQVARAAALGRRNL